MPKVLLATTCRWISAARMGMALHEAGFSVEALCPSGHPLRTTDVFSRIYPCSGLRPGASLLHACLRSQPDMVVPCDEWAAQLLRRLHGSKTTPDPVRQLIERSLGDPSRFPVIESRSEFLASAQAEGIAVPPTTLLGSEEDLERWLSEHPLPAVLKVDGTSGGEGVQMVTSRESALQAFRTLHAPLPTAVVLKRSIVDREYKDLGPWLARAQRRVSIQPLIDGHDANIAFLAWNGEVLASIAAEVLKTAAPRGPAVVVKLLDSPALLHALERLARRLGLSGFGGLDFLIENSTGKPYLIELNARLTQTSHLALSSPHDLAGALHAALTGAPLRERRSPVATDTIALFPGAWQCDPNAEVLSSGYHDVPWQQPALVRAAMAPPSRINRQNWLALKARLRAPWRVRSGQKHEA